jgi:uncharacterized membrane protein
MEDEHSELGFERVVFFSDAVFAIVITLLVLPLTSELLLPKDGDTAAQVLAVLPRIATFVVSFLVVGQFWVAHHRTFGRIRRADPGLVWLNLLGLLTVAFMPFPAALLGDRPSGSTDQFAVVFFAASMTLTSALFTITWLYAWRRRLVDPGVGFPEARVITLRALVSTGVLAASIPAALLGLPVAVVFWLVVMPAARRLVSRRPRTPKQPVAPA